MTREEIFKQMHDIQAQICKVTETMLEYAVKHYRGEIETKEYNRLDTSCLDAISVYRAELAKLKVLYLIGTPLDQIIFTCKSDADDFLFWTKLAKTLVPVQVEKELIVLERKTWQVGNYKPTTRRGGVDRFTKRK